MRAESTRDESLATALTVVQENLDLMRALTSRESPTFDKELHLILDHARAVTAGLNQLSTTGAGLSAGTMTVVLLVRDAIQPLSFLADRLLNNPDIDGRQLLRALTHPNPGRLNSSIFGRFATF